MLATATTYMGWYAVWGASVRGAALARANQANRDSGSFASRCAADARPDRASLQNTPQARGCRCRGRLKFLDIDAKEFSQAPGIVHPIFRGTNTQSSHHFVPSSFIPIASQFYHHTPPNTTHYRKYGKIQGRQDRIQGFQG